VSKSSTGSTCGDALERFVSDYLPCAFIASLARRRSFWRMTSMPLSKNLPTLAKLDKLAESLFEKLEQLKTAAREMAEHQASIEEQIRSLEGSKG
jgi:hypothetical protein